MGKRRRLFSALSIGCAVLVATPSWAAVIEPGYGDLTINQGQGFKPVAGRANANVGDSVMVGPGGSATVVYEDGCKVDIRPGAVTTIAPLSPCASGSNAQNYNGCPIGSDGRPHVMMTGAGGSVAFYWQPESASQRGAPVKATALQRQFSQLAHSDVRRRGTR